MSYVAFCKVRFDSTVPQFLAMVFLVVGTVCIDGRKMLFRMLGFARNRRRVVDKWKKLRHVVKVRPS